MAGIKGDFTGFTFKGIHSSALGITRVSGGDRYNLSLLPPSKDQTAEAIGANKIYYFNTAETQREFALSIAFDSISEVDLRRLTRLFSDYTPGALIFDETPYKYYTAKINGEIKLNYICFTNADNARVYKGDCDLTFVCYDPMARSRFKFLDEYNSANIPIWDNDAGNITEWSEAIGLLETQNSVDVVYYNSDNINIYNPGDKTAPFKAYILGVYNESTQLYDYNCKIHIVEDNNKQLIIYGSSIYSVICIDMQAHLTLTCDSIVYITDPNGILYKNGTNYLLRTGVESAPFYNIDMVNTDANITEDFFYAGNYFDIGISFDTNSIYTLQLSAGVDGVKKGKIIGIEYKYLFY